MVALSPSCQEPSGRHPDVPTEPPWHPNTYLSPSASCLRYLTPVFPLPVPAHSSQTERPRFVPHRAAAPTTPPARRRGEVGMFRRDIRVSEAERGRVPCRSKEHTASTRQKIKPQTIRSGACGAADGNRTRVSGLGSVRSTIELQPHLFQCIAPACWG